MSAILKRKPHILVLAALIIVFLIISLSLYTKTSAVPGLPFGGFVSRAVFCPSCGVVLVVGPPRGGNFLVTPLTVLYEYGQVRPGVWVLGDYRPGGSCISCSEIGGGKGGSIIQCVSLITVTGTVNFMGTSL